MQKTPCEMGYNCPYCKVVDNLHLVCMLPKCPIEWINEDTVVDTLTNWWLPFVKRPEPKQRKDDDTPLFPDDKIPIYERRHGNVVQMEPKNRL